MLRNLIIILTLISIVSCKEHSSSSYIETNSESNKYAKWFRVSDSQGYKQLEIVNPWDTTRLLGRYILVSKQDSIPSNIPEGTIVRTPVESVVVFGGVDAGVIDFIGQVDKVSGVCDGKYFSNPSIKSGLESGEIVDIGSSTLPSVEKLIAVKPELIILSPYQNSDFGAIEKMNIPIVKSVSYMENLPLGQSEWIVFLSYFFEKEAMANHEFEQIESRYNKAKEIVKDITSKKSILPGKRYGASWHVAAAKSYMANIYRDAAAAYPWEDSNTTGSLSLSFEEVFSKAKSADIWVITYNNPVKNMNYDELKSEYQNYCNFDAFKNRKVYGCNSANSPIFERALITPDLLLSDYIKMLYPEMMSDYEFTFFNPLDN